MKEIYAPFLILHTCRAPVASAAPLTIHRKNAPGLKKRLEEVQKYEFAQYAERGVIIHALVFCQILSRLLKNKIKLH
tara:strand:+ start:375 stop:605 length:231 start_codon:yes stop_codon:yes gene_type:complete